MKIADIRSFVCNAIADQGKQLSEAVKVRITCILYILTLYSVNDTGCILGSNS